VDDKATVQSQINQVGNNPLAWLEPAEKFLNTLSEATLALSSHEILQKANFLKKTGSNLKIKDKVLGDRIQRTLKNR